MELDGHIARTEKAIVLELDKEYAKIGFTGDDEPRCIVPSGIRCSSELPPPLPSSRLLTEYLYLSKKNAEKLYDALVNLLDLLFFKNLGVNPREYKIVIVAVTSSDRKFYETLEEVLYTTYKVPGVIWADSRAMSGLTLGTPALIVSIGAKTILVSPVAHSDPWDGSSTFTPEIHSSLQSSLEKDNNTNIHLLQQYILEDIIIKACYVITRERAQKWANGETLDAKSVEYHMPDNEKNVASMKVSGRTRELALEPLFTTKKFFSKITPSLPRAILNCIAGCPAEFRRDLAANILITGGMAALPGMKARLEEELRYLSKLEYQEIGVEEFKFHPDNHVAWLGGASAGARVAEAIRFVPRVVVPDGTGEPLGSIPGLPLSEFDSEDLGMLHRYIYGQPCIEGDTLRNILKFQGFRWNIHSEKRHKDGKIDDTIELGVTDVETMCKMLNLESTGSLHDMSERLVDFLHSPRRDYESDPKPKSLNPPEKSPVSGVKLPAGKGIRLGSHQNFEELNSNEASLLHQYIYGSSRPDFESNMNNINEFCGYECVVGSLEYQCRLEIAYELTCSVHRSDVKRLCKKLNLDYGGVETQAGRGTPLGKLFKMEIFNYIDIDWLHDFMYEPQYLSCRAIKLINVKKFRGFEFDITSPEFRCRLFTAEKNCFFRHGEIMDVCKKLNLGHLICSWQDLAPRLMNFLHTPGVHQEFQYHSSGVTAPAGMGLPLGALFQFENFKKQDLKLLHWYIYDKGDVDSNIIRNIKKFYGFACDVVSWEYLDRVQDTAEQLHQDLRTLCNMLSLGEAGTRYELAERLVRFLHTPVREKHHTVFTDLPIPAGTGVPLGDIFSTDISLFTPEELKMLHYLLYDKRSSCSNMIRNVKKFHGFEWELGSWEHKFKVEETTVLLTPDEIQTLCKMLHLDVEGTTTEMAERLVTFLQRPTYFSYDIVTSLTDQGIVVSAANRRAFPALPEDDEPKTAASGETATAPAADETTSKGPGPVSASAAGGTTSKGPGPVSASAAGGTTSEGPGPVSASAAGETTTKGPGPVSASAAGGTTSKGPGPVSASAAGETTSKGPGPVSASAAGETTSKGPGPVSASAAGGTTSKGPGPVSASAAGETTSKGPGPVSASAAGGTTSKGPGPVSASAAGGTTSKGPGPVSASAAGGTTSKGPGPVSASAAGGTTSKGPGPVSASAAGGTTSKGPGPVSASAAGGTTSEDPEQPDGGSVPGEVSVLAPPGDAVSSLRFSPAAAGGRFLLAAGWDCRVRCWEVRKGQEGISTMPVAMHSMSGPILDVAWHHDGSKVFMASTDKTVKCWDLVANTAIQVGSHDGPVSTCHWVTSPNCNVLMTGSWDKTLKFWDLRSRDHVTKIELPERCYCADAVYPMAVVGTADQKIGLYSLTGKPAEVARFDSPLRHQHSCIAIFNHQHAIFKNKYPVGFALGDVGGQVAIKYVNISNAKDGYTFQCHRTTGKHQYQEAYAVNDMCFSPSSATLATAGSDGRYSFWDYSNSNPQTSARRAQPLTNCCFDHSGELFAYAVGYDWSKGHEYFNRDSKTAIYIRPFSEDLNLTEKY